MNLDFVDDPVSVDPVPQRRVLTLDAPGVAGVAGARKPVVSEMLDRLAAEAGRRGLPSVGLVNGDIIVSPEAIARVRALGRPAVAISRIDIGEGLEPAPMLYGIDLFVFDVAFWRRERRRFRPYLLGEAVWDNVYAAITICHGGLLVNREPLIQHARHPSAVRDSPFERYVHALATRDSSYFTLWCQYVAEAERLRARGGSIDEEYALQRSIFRPPGAGARATDVARAAWWRAKRALAR